MPDASIFISYRRDDSAGYARALYDDLARRWGPDRVFIDVDDIGAGQSFADVIRDAVGASEVLLVLIGQRWQGERNGQAPRLYDSNDFVRLEVAAALSRGMRVIPVLLDGAAMPSADQLPEPLRALAGRNAVELSPTRFAADLQRLQDALVQFLGAAGPLRQEAPPSVAVASPRLGVAWLAGGVLVVGLAVWAAGVFWSQRNASQNTNGTASASGSAPARSRPAINGKWQAVVEYDWPNSRYTERFEFDGDADELHGSASFLGAPSVVFEGSSDGDGLRFVTRTSETSGAPDGTREIVHRYRGRLVENEIYFVMQTEGGTSRHMPVEFVARRTPGGAAQPGR